MCAYLRLDNIKESIEGDANLHHPPGIGLKSELVMYASYSMYCPDITNELVMGASDVHYKFTL